VADLPKVRGNIASSKGIGESLITDFLADVPGVRHAVGMQAAQNFLKRGLIDQF
jgi:hypothetical protein